MSDKNTHTEYDLSDIIEGQKQILDYLGWGSWRRVKRLNLPVAKLGGRWMAQKSKIDQWMKIHIDV